jgi:hypothetical protein
MATYYTLGDAMAACSSEDTERMMKDALTLAAQLQTPIMDALARADALAQAANEMVGSARTATIYEDRLSYLADAGRLLKGARTLYRATNDQAGLRATDVTRNRAHELLATLNEEA